MNRQQQSQLIGFMGYNIQNELLSIDILIVLLISFINNHADIVKNENAFQIILQTHRATC